MWLDLKSGGVELYASGEGCADEGCGGAGVHVTYVAWEKEERFSASGLALARAEAARKRLTHAMSFI